MEVLIPVLIVLFILLVIITLVGHGIWVALAFFFRTLTGRDDQQPPVQTLSLQTNTTPHPCLSCSARLTVNMKFCGRCGAHRPTLAQEEQLRELAITLRQLERLCQAGEYEAEFQVLKNQIAAERERILFPHGRPTRPPQAAASPAPEKSRP